MNEARGGAGAYLLVMLIAGGAGFYFDQQALRGDCCGG